MKNLFLILAFSFATSFSFANSNSTLDVPPHTVLTSCGGSFTYDDEGLTIDQQFDIAEMIDNYFCG
jgi:hypothetical protein